MFVFTDINDKNEMCGLWMYTDPAVVGPGYVRILKRPARRGHTFVVGLNNRSDVVGTSRFGASNPLKRAVVWPGDGHGVFRLDELTDGAADSVFQDDPLDINDRRWILVPAFHVPTSRTRTLLLVPSKEEDAP